MPNIQSDHATSSWRFSWFLKSCEGQHCDIDIVKVKYFVTRQKLPFHTTTISAESEGGGSESVHCSLFRINSAL